MYSILSLIIYLFSIIGFVSTLFFIRFFKQCWEMDSYDPITEWTRHHGLCTKCSKTFKLENAKYLNPKYYRVKCLSQCHDCINRI